MSNSDTKHNDQSSQIILDIIAPLKDQAGALLPILHQLQESLGYIPELAIPLIAKSLNLSRADVHGVVSFYHHFRSTKPGKHVIQLCRAESCQAMGAKSLEHYAKQLLGIDYHQTTEDGQFSLEPVYCLGNCACSPSIRVADEIYSDMDPQKFEQLLGNLP
jgi:formate dehydrogenase subunit gamma